MSDQCPPRRVNVFRGSVEEVVRRIGGGGMPNASCLNLCNLREDSRDHDWQGFAWLIF